MATNINTILNWFMTGKKPTQAQFWASWGSFWHKDETIPQSSISELTTVLNAKTENDQFNAHKTDANAHADLFASKEDKNKKGVANGYVPLNEFVQIASQYLQITDDLITGGHDSLLSAEQGKNLQIQIDGINTLLTSNNINLDTVQEIVDAIETVQTSLSTILVNDLTTGGTTKALTAEMGKILKILVDSLSTNKLEKGGYAGTAQQLKTEIDDIYQPDVLIRSVPPTRVGDTFTYPAGEYEYILSKTHHINAANFSVTILAAPTDYKRTDLIYAKPDNSLAKLGGTESLTVAIRPDVPAGCVGISFINVFGATISDPTPIDTQISIQDSLGIEKFKITDYLRFKGVSFNVGAKQIDIDPLVPLSAFLDTTTGNDSTGTIENSRKPFLTIDKLLDSLPATTGETYNIYINSANVVFTKKLPNRSLNFISYTDTILNFSSVRDAGSIPAGLINAGTGQKFYNFSGKNISIVSTISSSLGEASQGSNVSFTGYLKNVTFGGIIVMNTLSNLTIEVLNETNTPAYLFSNVNYSNTIPCYLNIVTFNVQYGKILINTQYCIVDIKEIKQVGTTNITVTLNNTGILDSSIGNINFIGTFIPKSRNVFFNGVMTSTVNLNFVGTTKVKGTITSTNYIYSWIYTPITFENFTGKLGGWRMYGSAVMNFINCNITTDTWLLSREDDNPTPNVAFFYGYNTINKISATDYVFRSKTGHSSSTQDNPIVVTIIGTIKSNVTSYGYKVSSIDQMLTFKEKLNEVVIRDKVDLVNKTLNSQTTYIIDGTITLLTGEYIQVPAGGLTIAGYGFDVSQINKNVAGQSIFISPAGNSGNFVTRDIQYNSGVGTVFNITDSDGSHAIEFNDVNFQSCAALGTFNGYRQFTATTCGFYGCSDGFTLEGTWNGFKITNSNVIGFGASGTFIKKGASTSFNNRLYIDLNMSIATGSKICDFQDSNFASNKLLQVVNCLVKVNGVIDSTTTSATFPNISPFSAKAYFTNNIGVKNSFNEPYGLKTTYLATYANDTDAATGNIQLGEVYIETATGYFKTRLV
jgi:hypothetical protein